jgi:hypothetical protein
MHGGRLLCPAHREAKLNAERQSIMDAEEAGHKAWVERVKAAARGAAQTLKTSNRPVALLAVTEEKVKVKKSAYGDVYSRNTWRESKETVGYGWVLFTATHNQLEGSTTRATVALAEDGDLFWAIGETEVELGRERLLSGPRATVLPVHEALDLHSKETWNPAREVALDQLEGELTKLST